MIKPKTYWEIRSYYIERAFRDFIEILSDTMTPCQLDQTRELKNHLYEKISEIKAKE